MAKTKEEPVVDAVTPPGNVILDVGTPSWVKGGVCVLVGLMVGLIASNLPNKSLENAQRDIRVAEVRAEAEQNRLDKIAERTMKRVRYYAEYANDETLAADTARTLALVGEALIERELLPSGSPLNNGSPTFRAAIEPRQATRTDAPPYKRPGIVIEPPKIEMPDTGTASPKSD